MLRGDVARDVQAVRLDDLDGLEATRRLSRNPATAAIPVIAVTASALGNIRQAARDAGCVDYLSKPIRAQVLFGMLRTHLGVRLVGGSGQADAAGEALTAEQRADVAACLRDAVSLGDVSDIHRLAELLVRGTAAEAAIGERINRLVTDFDFSGLSGLADSLTSQP